jgi:hypothetical protein
LKALFDFLIFVLCLHTENLLLRNTGFFEEMTQDEIMQQLQTSLIGPMIVMACGVEISPIKKASPWEAALLIKYH